MPKKVDHEHEAVIPFAFLQGPVDHHTPEAVVAAANHHLDRLFTRPVHLTRNPYEHDPEPASRHARTTGAPPHPPENPALDPVAGSGRQPGWLLSFCAPQPCQPSISIQALTRLRSRCGYGFPR